MAKKSDYPFPANLVYDMIFNPNEAVAFIGDGLSEDRIKGIEYALTRIRDRERYAIVAHYRDGLTFRAIAHEVGISIEGARQLVMSGKRKLRHPYLFKYFDKGFIAASAEDAKTAKIKAEEERRDEHVTLDSGIQSLGLSTRSLNGLRRHGVKKVRELVGMTVDDFTKIPNIGYKSALEILAEITKVINGDADGEEKEG